jgi:hypothetical protein
MTTSTPYFTPYDDDYGTCAETRATLRIYTGSLDPNIVTQRLGRSPTQLNEKGSVKVSKSGRQRIVPLNAWFLTSDGSVNSRDLRRHLDWLLEALAPAKGPLLELQGLSDVTMAVTCAWYSVDGHGGPALWPRQMARLVELNLECNFDLYFLSDEDD